MKKPISQEGDYQEPFKTTFFGTPLQSLQYFGLRYTFANLNPKYWSDWQGYQKKLKSDLHQPDHGDCPKMWLIILGLTLRMPA